MELSSWKSRFNHSTKWTHFFFSFICGIQAIFTVGGKESLTVSNYLKNKTTHTTQNKSKIYTANCWETQKPQLPVIKIFFPNYHKAADLESICVSAQCFSCTILASWDHSHVRVEAGSALVRCAPWLYKHVKIQPSHPSPSITLHRTKDNFFFKQFLCHSFLLFKNEENSYHLWGWVGMWNELTYEKPLKLELVHGKALNKHYN